MQTIEVVGRVGFSYRLAASLQLWTRDSRRLLFIHNSSVTTLAYDFIAALLMFRRSLINSLSAMVYYVPKKPLGRELFFTAQCRYTMLVRRTEKNQIAFNCSLNYIYIKRNMLHNPGDCSCTIIITPTDGITIRHTV